MTFHPFCVKGTFQIQLNVTDQTSPVSTWQEIVFVKHFYTLVEEHLMI